MERANEYQTQLIDQYGAEKENTRRAGSEI